MIRPAHGGYPTPDAGGKPYYAVDALTAAQPDFSGRLSESKLVVAIPDPPGSKSPPHPLAVAPAPTLTLAANLEALLTQATLLRDEAAGLLELVRAGRAR